jgi:hypothetical protein
MDSCQPIYQRTTSNIVANLISLRNSSVKREKLVKTLESHLSNGTFPSNLNFNLAHFQFPASATEEEKEDLNKIEADGILRFQTVTYRMYICTFVAKRADGQIVLNEEKM